MLPLEITSPEKTEKIAINPRETAKLSIAFVTYAKRNSDGSQTNAAFVPDLVSIYMNGLDAGAADRERATLGSGKMSEAQAIDAATYKLPALPNGDTGQYIVELEKHLVAELSKIYNDLQERETVFPPITMKEWLTEPQGKSYLTKLKQKFNYWNSIKMQGIVPESYRIHDADIEIEHYQAGWWEQHLPTIARVLAFVVTVSWLVSYVLTLTALNFTSVGATTFIFLGLFWYNLDDFLDRANRIGPDCDRYAQGRYTEVVGERSVPRILAALVTFLLGGSVAAILGYEAYSGAALSLLQHTWLPAWLATSSVISGFAILVGVTIAVGTMITLGYSLARYFGFSMRQPQFEIARVDLTEKEDLFRNGSTEIFTGKEVTRLYAHKRKLQPLDTSLTTHAASLPLTPRLEAKAKRAGII